ISVLGIQEAAPELYALIRGPSSPDAKIAALHALRELQYEQIDQAIGIALSAESQPLRTAAIGMTPTLEIADSQKVSLLSSVLSNGGATEQQNAIRALGSLESKAAEEVLQNQFSALMEGNLPKEIHLELVTAAEQSASEKLQAMLAKYKAAKDEDDMVKRYREALHGGDAERGSRIFYEDNSAQCTRCHAVGGEGGNVGPDLSAIGDLLDREQLLASMVDPDKRIAPGF